MSVTPYIRSKRVSEVKNAAIDLTLQLEAAELLTGTPTIVEVTTTDLTLSNKGISTAALLINGATVAIAKAVQFKVAGGVAGTTYEIRITAVTNSVPAETIIETIHLEVKAD